MDSTAGEDKRYHPNSYAEIVFPNSLAEQQVNDWIRQKGKRNLILVGGFGSGKTAVAELLPKLREEAMGYSYDGGFQPTAIICRSKKFSRQTDLLEHTLTVATFSGSGKRYLVFNEFDAYNKTQQQPQLRTALDTANASFILTSNTISKIDEGIVSRCEVIEWPMPPFAAALPRLLTLAMQLGKVVSNADLESKVYTTTWRDTLSALERF